MGAICNQGIIYGGSTPINDASSTNKTTYSSNKIESRLAETQSIIGESYDPTKSYAVKERFIDGNMIYTVKVACTGVTPPNSTYYTGRRVVDEIAELDSEINNKSSLQAHDIVRQISVSKDNGYSEAIPYSAFGSDVLYNNVVSCLLTGWGSSAIFVPQVSTTGLYIYSTKVVSNANVYIRLITK